MAEKRLFLVPVEISDNARKAKYLRGRTLSPSDIPELQAASWSGMDYGEQDVMLVVVEVDSIQHALLAANLDVLALPLNIDQLLAPVAVSIVQTALEAHHIPADWVDDTFTYRQILKLVAGMFQFLQRCHGIGMGKLFSGAISLDTLFNQLPAAVRQKLIEAAQGLYLDYSSLTGGSSLRQILKAMGQQWATRSYALGLGYTI